MPGNGFGYRVSVRAFPGLGLLFALLIVGGIVALIVYLVDSRRHHPAAVTAGPSRVSDSDAPTDAQWQQYQQWLRFEQWRQHMHGPTSPETATGPVDPPAETPPSAPTPPDAPTQGAA